MRLGHSGRGPTVSANLRLGRSHGRRLCLERQRRLLRAAALRLLPVRPVQCLQNQLHHVACLPSLSCSVPRLLQPLRLCPLLLAKSCLCSQVRLLPDCVQRPLPTWLRTVPSSEQTRLPRWHVCERHVCPWHVFERYVLQWPDVWRRRLLRRRRMCLPPKY